MTTIITRLYANRTMADHVMSDLQLEGFGMRDIDLFTRDDAGDSDALAAQLKRGGVYQKAAAQYADHVMAGHALVVLRAPFGQALRGERVMDRTESVPTDVKFTEVFAGGSGSAGIYHSKYQPALLDNDHIMSGDLMPGTMRSTTPASSLFGLPLLIESRGKAKLMTDRPTWFSSLLNLNLLIKGGPRARLTRSSTPFSSALSLPLLSK